MTIQEEWRSEQVREEREQGEGQEDKRAIGDRDSRDSVTWHGT
jgi:hypothetical protein